MKAVERSKMSPNASEAQWVSLTCETKRVKMCLPKEHAVFLVTAFCLWYDSFSCKHASFTNKLLIVWLLFGLILEKVLCWIHIASFGSFEQLVVLQRTLGLLCEIYGRNFCFWCAAFVGFTYQTFKKVMMHKKLIESNLSKCPSKCKIKLTNWQSQNSSTKMKVFGRCDLLDTTAVLNWTRYRSFFSVNMELSGVCNTC